MSEETKHCHTCDTSKPVGMFYRRKSNGSLSYQCKQCTIDKYKDRYRSDPGFAERAKSRASEWAKTDRGKGLHSVVAKRYTQTEKGKRTKVSNALRYQRDNREKILAHKAVYAAVKKGKLVKHPCAVCGDEKADGHHEDYSKRLDVVWLCRIHHKQLHLGQIPLPIVQH